MVKAGPDVPAHECELADVRAIEVIILWDATVVHVAHAAPPRAFYIGEPTRGQRVDFAMAGSEIGAPRWQLLEMRGDVPHVRVPPNASGLVVKRASSVVAPGTLEEPEAIALTSDTSVQMTIGRVRCFVSAVNAGKPAVRAGLAQADRTSAACFSLTFAAHAAILGALAFFTPALGLADDGELDQDRLYVIQQYLGAAAERERRDADGPMGTTGEASPSSETSEAARGRAGKMGKFNAPAVARRSAVAGPRDNTDPHLAREQALREASTFGLIGMLASFSGDPDSLTVPWGRDTALGIDQESAIGNMWALDIGEAAGSGGLQVSGTEQGGGGLGAGIGLDRIGTCEGITCAGTPFGFGSSAGRRGPEHKTTGPRLRAVGTTVVGGRLPAEVIQRVVRQNFGRFRQCYENGLRTNPNLEGRVAVRFVIGRDGAVSNAANGGSDLPDGGVVSCVIGAYYGLSFPAPEAGIVSVVYPILFQPGG
jgi:hypothetical protein